MTGLCPSCGCPKPRNIDAEILAREDATVRQVYVSLTRQETTFLSALLERHTLPVPVDDLIVAVWPAREPERPEVKLAGLAWQVRHKIGRWIVKDWRGYRLRQEPTNAGASIDH